MMRCQVHVDKSLVKDATQSVIEPTRQNLYARAGGMAVLAASNLLIAGAAQAQVLDRYFPANVPAYQDWAEATSGPPVDLGYAPVGIHFGDFIVYPSLTERLGYSTNPFGAPNGVPSATEQTNASITANSNWSRNSLNAYVNVSNTQYLRYSQSFTDWTISLGSTIQVADNMLEFGYVHVSAVQLPTTFGAFAQTQPVDEQDDDLRASYTFGSGRISLVPALQGDVYRFGATSVGSNDSAEAQGLYGRDALTTSLTANLQFAGGHNLLAILSDSVVQYGGRSAQRPANYNDISFLVGIEYRSSAVLAYRALVGYEDRMSTSRGVTDQTLAAPTAELDVLWNPTTLTGVTGKVSQNFQNSPTDGGQGVSETSVQIVVTHSLTRAVDIQGSARYLNASFPEDGGNEQGAFTTLRVNWHLSRHIVLSAEYDFSLQSGNNSNSLSYRDHEIYVQGKLQW
jgi:hypothetical protein